MEFPAVPATLPASLPTVALVGWWPSVVGSALGPKTSSEIPGEPAMPAAAWVRQGGNPSYTAHDSQVKLLRVLTLGHLEVQSR